MNPGKTIVVTGASGNMGQAVVNKFLEAGYNVIGTAVPNDPFSMETGHEKFEKVVVDLMNEDLARNFIDDVIKKHSTIEAAVLTVGGFAMGSIAETKASDIYKQYQLNFETAYHIVRPLLSYMLSQDNGRIFLVGSRPGLDAKSGKGMVGYSLAKSLIFRLAEIINSEAKGKNVVASVLVPSTIDTPQNRKSMPDADFSKWVSPEAIAETVYFYCTDKAAALREPVIKLYNNA